MDHYDSNWQRNNSATYQEETPAQTEHLLCKKGLIIELKDFLAKGTQQITPVPKRMSFLGLTREGTVMGP